MANQYAYKVINGKEPMLRRMACEVRYQNGQLYLDHCGHILKKLLQASPEWVSPTPTPQGTSVFHLVDGLQLSFSQQSATLDLNKQSSEELIDAEEAENFVQKTEEVLGFVLDELEVTEFTRLGFREWYYFSFENKNETEQWIQDLGIFCVAPSLPGSFQATLEALGTSLVMKGQNCHYRIALDGIERMAEVPIGATTLNVRASAVSKKQNKVLIEALKKQRQRQISPRFAVQLDIDAYRLEPIELGLAEFIREVVTTNLDRFRSAVPKHDGKKGK